MSSGSWSLDAEPPVRNTPRNKVQPIHSCRFVGVTRTQALAQVSIDGTIGSEYRAEYSDHLSATNWTVLTNLTLPASPHRFTDVTSSNTPQRFYRAIGVIQK